MSTKILVVDDDQAVRKMLSLLFESTCEVLTASNGADGLRLLAEHRPRLMLLDMVMPEMSGLEVLKAARLISPAMRIIMLTGKTDVELAKKALEMGATEYVTKPFDMNRLKEEVKRSLPAAAADERNSHGAPWRVIEPVIPAVSAAGQSAPAEEGISRWEGEGGETKLGESNPQEVK
jgi:two-component system response regulator MprA